MQFSPATFKESPPRVRGPAVAGRVDDVRASLEAGGVDSALATLNRGVPHRYTGIFRLDGDMLRNTHMFDKQGEVKPQGLENVVLSDSFCQIVLRDGFFLTEHSGKDHRLDYSPYQNVVLSYHGVPILRATGELYGTLCHFDMAEQSISDDEFICLQETAALLAERVQG